MTQESNQNGDVALFIDWENFKISLAVGHRTPNVSALKEEVSNYGRVVVAKAYADWVSRAPELRGASQFTIDPPALYAAGIEPVYVPTRLPLSGAPSDSNRTTRVKNSVDVKMTADCIECAHSYPNIDTFVLVSGDSDFIHVVNSLRTMGKRVIIIGVSWSTSRRLADQVDGLVLYDVDVDPVTSTEPSPAELDRGPVRLASPSRHQLPDVLKTIEDIVRTERQAGRTPLLTSLKQRLMRRIPGFDEKKLGFSGFKKLMLRAAQEGNIKLVTVGLVDWVLMADEPDPPEAVTEHSGTTEVGAGHPTDTTSLAPQMADAAQPDTNGNGRRRRGPFSRGKVEAVEPPAPARDMSTVPTESLDGIALPQGPDDGRDRQRVIDLIVMADSLEHREGISHVAFNFLVVEICQALEEGLKAEQEEIAQHWTAMHSRTYVTKLLRSLGNAGVFQRGWHTGRDKETGRSRRRSTFNLNQDHELVKQVLQAQWTAGEPADTMPETAAVSAQVSDDVEYGELNDNSLPEEQKAASAPSETGPQESSSGIAKVMRLFTRS